MDSTEQQAQTLDKSKIEEKFHELVDWIEQQKSLSSNIPDAIKAQGFTLRTGNKLLKFTLSSEETLPIDDAKLAMHALFIEKLNKIKTHLEEHLSASFEAIEVYKNDLEDKKAEYQRKVLQLNLMPDINYAHVNAGLSVAKGQEPNQITWLFRGIYAPKYYTKNEAVKAIPQDLFRHMACPVLVEIITSNEETRPKVLSVTLRNICDYKKFSHYHKSASSDCWGDWNFSLEKCDSPDDILKIAKKALKILETINDNSPGTKEPLGMPKLEEIRRAVVPLTGEVGQYALRVNNQFKRMGFLSNLDTTIQARREQEPSAWTL